MEFLKASIADLITLLFSSLQNAESGGDGNSIDTPANFYHFQRPKFNFQPLSFIFETFGKKLAETKMVARVNVKKIKEKQRKKGLKIVGDEAATIFYQNLSITARDCGFLAAAEALKCY